MVQFEELRTLDTLRPRKQLPLFTACQYCSFLAPAASCAFWPYLDVETHPCRFGCVLPRGGGSDVALSANSQERRQPMEELRGKDWYTMHKTASREFLPSRGRCQVPTWNRNVFDGGGSTAKAYQPQGSRGSCPTWQLAANVPGLPANNGRNFSVGRPRQ